MNSHFQQNHLLKILLVDSQELFREGLISMLKNEPDIQIIGEADTAKEGYKKAIELKPEIILMDIFLPDEDGLKLTKDILGQMPQIKIVILTSQDCLDLMISALISGAKGYLPKNTSIKNVLVSLRAVMRGELAINRMSIPLILEELLRLKRMVSSKDCDERKTYSGLTPRELEVLRLLGTQASNRDIAKILCISGNTVKVHVSRILVKLNCKTRSEAGEFARRCDDRYPSVNQYLDAISYKSQKNEDISSVLIARFDPNISSTPRLLNPSF